MTAHPALAWLDGTAAARRAAGLHRDPVVRTPGSTVVDLASNDYLGLTRHPEVLAGATAALRRWGAGATGSRLVTGTTAEHELLERELADFVGADSGLVFSSGYAANLGAVAALGGKDALIVSDAGGHASRQQAAARKGGAGGDQRDHRETDTADVGLDAEQAAQALADKCADERAGGEQRDAVDDHETSQVSEATPLPGACAETKTLWSRMQVLTPRSREGGRASPRT